MLRAMMDMQDNPYFTIDVKEKTSWTGSKNAVVLAHPDTSQCSMSWLTPSLR